MKVKNIIENTYFLNNFYVKLIQNDRMKSQSYSCIQDFWFYYRFLWKLTIFQYFFIRFFFKYLFESLLEVYRCARWDPLNALGWISPRLWNVNILIQRLWCWSDYIKSFLVCVKNACVSLPLPILDLCGGGAMAEPEEKEVERNSAKAIQREIQILFPTSPNIQNQSSFFEWYLAIWTILNCFAWKRIWSIKIAELFWWTEYFQGTIIGSKNT